MLRVVISVKSFWKPKSNVKTKDEKLKCVFSHFFPPFFVDKVVIKLNDENDRSISVCSKDQELQKEKMVVKSAKKQALVS